MLTPAQKAAIPRIELKGDDVDAIGAGFLLSADLVVTAFHVVAACTDEDAVNVGISLIFEREDGQRIERTAQMTPHLCKTNDWAILRLTKTVDDISPLEWTVAPGSGKAVWCGFGYPKTARQDDLGGLGGHSLTDEKVVDWEKRHRGSKCIQLQLQHSAGLNVHGLSGSPCIVRGSVVGIIKRRLPGREDGMATAGILYATPIGLLVEALKQVVPALYAASEKQAAAFARVQAAYKTWRDKHQEHASALPPFDRVIAMTVLEILTLAREVWLKDEDAAYALCDALLPTARDWRAQQLEQLQRLSEGLTRLHAPVRSAELCDAYVAGFDGSPARIRPEKRAWLGPNKESAPTARLKMPAIGSAPVFDANVAVDLPYQLALGVAQNVDPDEKFEKDEALFDYVDSLFAAAAEDGLGNAYVVLDHVSNTTLAESFGKTLKSLWLVRAENSGAISPGDRGRIRSKIKSMYPEEEKS